MQERDTAFSKSADTPGGCAVGQSAKIQRTNRGKAIAFSSLKETRVNGGKGGICGGRSGQFGEQVSLNYADLVLSAQVLQEFYVQAVRASRKTPLSHDHAAGLIESWIRFPIQEITAAIVVAALKTKERWQTSYWDAAIIEAARASGCEEERGAFRGP